MVGRSVGSSFARHLVDRATEFRTRVKPTESLTSNNVAALVRWHIHRSFFEGLTCLHTLSQKLGDRL